MCSAAIRTAARDLPNAGGWPGGLPFYETVNEAPSIASLPVTWFTLGFEANADDPVSIGPAPEYRETGRVVLSIMGRAGTGDGTLITLADAVPPLIRSHFAAAEIRIRSVSPASLVDDGIDGEFERYDLFVDFERSHT